MCLLLREANIKSGRLSLSSSRPTTSLRCPGCQSNIRVLNVTETWQRYRVEFSAMKLNGGLFSILMPHPFIPILIAPGIKMKAPPKSECDGHERQA